MITASSFGAPFVMKLVILVISVSISIGIDVIITISIAVISIITTVINILIVRKLRKEKICENGEVSLKKMRLHWLKSVQTGLR